MKKRILSLVLCAAMLLSMCLFMGAGVAQDTTADAGENAESYVPAVNFTNVAPFVQANAQAANGPARAPMLAANANEGSTTPADPARTTSDAVVTEKTATDLGGGQYQIKLTSYTTGTVTEQQTTKPTDIVLVLDQSGSMAEKFSQVSRANADKEAGKTEGAYVTPDGEKMRYNNGEWQYYTGFSSRWRSYSGDTFYSSRLLALKTAVDTFVNQVSKEATESDIDHRIAIVGFASTGGSYNNTELLSTSSVVNYSRANDANYRDALVSVNGTNGNINSRLTTAINRLGADGDTYSEHGIDMANKIFAQHNTASEAERQRVVVMFTDGYTAPSGTNDFKYSMADAAIEKAQTSKSTYKATVYTVGIFANADPSADITRNFKTSDGWSDWYNVNNLTAAQELTAANRYMHYVSSNYPNATSLNNGGNLSDKASPFTGGDSYYLSAGDAATLNSIFEKISNNISTPSIELGTQAYVKDTVSDYFTAPVDGRVTVTTQKAGYDVSGKLVWTDETTTAGLNVDVSGKTVKVSGFDYDVNFVSASDKGRDENDQKKPGSFYGRRLVVTFTVKAEPDFLGGNNVPTNTSDSGVYTKENTLVENYDYPRVNVSISAPTLVSKNANVYYGGDVPTAEELCTTGTVAAKMDDYVDIAYSADGTVSNTVDGSYQVTMTVSPKYSGAGAAGTPATEKTATVTSTVNVYKPEVTYRDSIINLGDTADYANNFVSAVWKHGDDMAADMTGTEPALTYVYDPEAGAFTQDTYVRATVSANGVELPDDVVTFGPDDSCDFPGCAGSFDSTKGQFIVHINVFDLTIEKKAANGTTIDPNQTFVFKVKNNTTNEVTEVVITGAGERMIKNLPMGSYTITEDTGWSWKYTPTTDSQTITVNETSATVTFENAKKDTNWLTSIADVINTWINGDVQKAN